MNISAIRYIVDNATAEKRNIIIRLHNGSIIISSSNECKIYEDWNTISLNNGEELVSCESIDHILKGDNA